MSAVRILARKTVRDLRNMTIGIGLSCFGTAILMVLVYPEIAEQYAELDLPDYYDVFLGEASLGTPEGFIAGEFFSWIPIIVVVMAVIAGTGAIAGEEANGTLELLLVQPMSRRAVFAAKAAGMGIAFTTMCLLSFPGMLIGRAIVDEFDLGIGPMVNGIVVMTLLVWLFLALSLLASAALPSRAMAGTVVAGVAVGSYIFTIIASLISALSDLRWLSPFSWADFPATLVHGIQWRETALLVAGTVVCTVLAVIAFERRDIGAAAFPGTRTIRLPAFVTRRRTAAE